MSTFVNNFTSKKLPKYMCEVCDFKCSKSQDYKRHVSTDKHQSLVAVNQMTTHFTPKNFLDKKHECPKCNKFFNDRSGLWRHNKKYHAQESQPEETQQEATIPEMTFEHDDCNFKEMFLEMMKQNEEFKQIMIEQNVKLMEMAKEKSSITNNNTITNTMNNKFNLQIFLNETCKDAMNIQEFIDYVKVQHSDFENFGKMGYVEALTRIFLRNLMELEVHRRPIHCSDVKREVLYVKDNDVWTIDVSREKLIRTIKYIANKNVKQIPGWMDQNPDSKNTQTKLHDKYMKMLCFSMGGRDEEEDQDYYRKIIRNVAREVIIDKTL